MAAPAGPPGVRPGALIRLEGITKTYQLGETQIQPLRDVSLAIDQGELVAIVGASGSGKTTLMNIIGCLDRPSAGHYSLDGEEVSGLNPNRLAYLRNKKFGFVFQSFNLLSRTSAVENVEFPLHYWSHLSPEERRAKALESLSRVGLADRVGHTPGQLSGGQQQRVAIARALVNAPGILLADEPTGNLDSKSASEIMALFGNLHAQGMTVIVITHNPDIAERAQRVIRIRDGMMQGVDP